jgi:hypothetical protein
MHRVKSLLVAAFVGGILALPGVRPAGAGERWAVLIGVDDYNEAQDLKYCAADQRSLREQLIVSGFSDDQVFLLVDRAAEPKYLPFKSNIEKQLGLVLNLLEEGDLVVVALSGHGVHLDGKSYFCPMDADPDDPQTLVSLDDLYRRFDESAAALTVLIVDACRNDPRLPNRRSADKLSPRDEAKRFTLSLEEPPQGVVLLNSCTAGEMSYEDHELKHGIFMHYVLEGLGGSADADADGRISIQELSRFANVKTKSYVARKFNDSQRPFLKGDLTIDVLDFALARASVPPPAVASPTVLPPIVSPPMPPPKTGTFADANKQRVTSVATTVFSQKVFIQIADNGRKLQCVDAQNALPLWELPLQKTGVDLKLLGNDVQVQFDDGTAAQFDTGSGFRRK